MKKKTHIRCEHGKIKFTCKKCAPGSFCVHGKANTRCAKCGGGSVCAHKKARQLCRECNPLGWARQALLRFRGDATKKGFEPPDISAEGIVELVNKTTTCCGCKQPLIFDYSLRRHMWSPSLHHSHITGTVIGYSHSVCNTIEGQFAKLSLTQRAALLDSFFPETVSRIKDRS
jgi:hypothetical protein